jgi:hypothetical protein
MPENDVIIATRHAHCGEELRRAEGACDLFPSPKIKKLNNQQKAILDYLKTGKSLTGYEAIRVAGSMKLSTRIGEMRDMGYKFQQEWIKTDTGKMVMRYWI